MKSLVKLIFGILILCSTSSLAQVYVRGHVKSNGTYVQPYYRSSPNSTLTDNYGYPGNTNPYTGKIATGSVDAYIRNHSSSNSTASEIITDLPPEYFIEKQKENIQRSLGQSSNSTIDLNNISSIPYDYNSQPTFVKGNTLIRKGPSKKYAILYQTVIPESIEVIDSYRNGWSKVSFTYVTRAFDYVQKIGYVSTSQITSSVR